MKILPKLLILLLALTIVPLGLLGMITLGDLQRLQSESTASINSLAVSVVHDSTESLNEIGSDMIKQIAEDVSKQIEIYLRANPQKTVKDLQEDEYFAAIAVQPVGKTGYTALTDVSTLTCRFHVNPAIVDLDLSNLAEKLPGFWHVMSKTQGGVISEGVYDWAEPDGSIREKYMYIAIVDAVTADGVRFSVAATTYLDEFSEPALEINQKIQTAVGKVFSDMEYSAEKVKRQTIIVIIGMIILVFAVGFFFAHSLTQPIRTINEAGRKVADGKLDTELPVLNTDDEIKELGNTMNLLMGAVKYLKSEANKKK